MPVDPNVRIVLESAPDKRGFALFTVHWCDKINGPSRKQYRGSLKWHTEYWTMRHRKVTLDESKLKKKGKKK